MQSVGNNEYLTQRQIRNAENVQLAGEVIFNDCGGSRKMHFLPPVLSWLVLVSVRLCFNQSHAKKIWATQFICINIWSEMIHYD